MKILQINKFFYLKGGSERYFFDVSDALEKAGHEIVHFSMQDERNRESPFSPHFIKEVSFQGKKSLGKGMHYIYSSEASVKIKKLIKQNKPDVAHLHNIAHQLTPSIIVALQQAGIPVVQTLHDYQLICPNYKLYTQGSPCERCKSHKYWNAIKYKCVQDSTSASALAAFEMAFHNKILNTYGWGVNKFIAPSNFLYTKLIEWGWKKSKLLYLPHFIDKNPAENVEKKQQVLFVGRLTKEKGVHIFLQAAEQLKDIDFVIAGTGEEEVALKKEIADKKLTNCKLVGFKNTKELDKLMQESLAVVIPSLWYENAPMVVYESLALGTPVIASKLGGLVELVKEGENGFLFEPDNADELAKTVKKLLNNNIPRTNAAAFSTEKHLKELVQLYESVQGERTSLFRFK